MYLSVNYIAFTVLLYQCLTIYAGESDVSNEDAPGCSMPIPEKGETQLPEPRREVTATSPLYSFGYVHFHENEKFTLACDHSQAISLKKSVKKTNKIFVKCIKKDSFMYNGKLYKYEDVKCQNISEAKDSNINMIPTTEDPYAVAVARHNAGLQDCALLLPDPDYNFMPIPFITNSTPAIIRPNKYGFFTIKANDEFKLTCGDSEFTLPVTGTNEITVKCLTSTFLEFDGRRHQFDRFRCKHIPTPKLVMTDQRCQTDDCKVAEVGFQSKSAFLVLYKLCFDPINLHTEYAWYHAYSPMYKLRQVSITKPRYIVTKTYGKVDVEAQYWNQETTLQKIFKSKENNSHIINRDDGRFVVKAHLISKSEFYYGFENHATYFYENTVPQWFRAAQGYWKDVERVFRRYLAENESHHVVVAGTYLTSTLPDKERVPYPFYLKLTTQMPVPQYLWKMNYDVKKNTGIVWVGLNNPTTNLNETMYLCDPVQCPQRMPRKTYHKKLMYCCTKESFEKVYGRLDPVVFGDFNTIPPHP